MKIATTFPTFTRDQQKIKLFTLNPVICSICSIKWKRRGCMYFT